MATATTEVEEIESAPKSKKKLIIIVIAILILAIGGGAAAYFFLFHKEDAHEEKQPVKEVKHQPLIYVPLENFVVNVIPEEDGDQVFLQIGINLQVEDNKDVDMIKANMPQVRSRLLMLLSNQSAKVLETPSGKTKLIEDILAELKRPFGREQGEQKITNVFFTSFIIQ